MSNSSSLPTWVYEGAVVTLALAATLLITGAPQREWIGALAVQLTFHHAAIADRMAEKQVMLHAHPGTELNTWRISCYRWSRRLFLSKEATWLVYFSLAHAWSALVGVFVFLLYPVWRRYWRRRHPL